MKSDGSIIPADNMERFKKVRDLAHQHNKKFIIEIAKGYESDNWYTLDNVIANHKTEFADNVLDMLKTYGADGVDLDFEYPSPDKNSVTNTPNTPLVEAFFKTLHTKLKAANSDYLISADTGRLTLFAVYANSNLSQYIDYIMHMGYHYTGDYHTGANSPFNDPKRFDVKDAVEDLLKYYPSQKIILGLPLWGYESQTDSDQPYAKVTKGSRKQIDLKTVIDRAAKYGRLWDTNSNSPWYRYKVGDKWYQGWYDDGESFRLKYNYIKSVNLGGIGCHALGWEAGYPTYENGYPEIWKEIFSDAYSLTVTNGSGSFIQGNKIDIIASSAPSDKVFDKWTGDTSYIASVTSASTSVTMPDKAVHLTATYKTASSSQPTGRSNIKDGAMIRVKGGIDVYIVKYNNGKQFKRLILSPSVFRSYGHLKWKDIIEVDQATLDSYTTSNLVYVAGDKRVWRLEPAGDNGKRSDCTSSSYDADGVYEINTTDRDSYKA